MDKLRLDSKSGIEVYTSSLTACRLILVSRVYDSIIEVYIEQIRSVSFLRLAADQNFWNPHTSGLSRARPN